MMNDETETLAQVVQLHQRQDDVEVVEGEVVTAAEWRALTQRQQAAERYRMYWGGTVATARTVKTVATHQHTRTVVRHVVYVGAGAAIAGKRAWDGRTVARYERMMRSAELRGDSVAALEWEERASRFRRERHERRMELLTAPQQVARSLGVSAGIAGGGLLALGLVLAGAERSIHEVALPFDVLFDLVRWLVIIASVTWGPIVFGAPWVAIATFWAIGRRRVELPAWVAPAGQDVEHIAELITPSVVVTALRDLGFSPLSKAIKAMPDNGAAMLGPITLAGPGVELDVYLPPTGVAPAELLAEKVHERLAANLGRHPYELHISIPPQARAVHLWAADSGALDTPVGPSPMVEDTDIRADYFAGQAPWGETLRGEPGLVRVRERHILITGASNMGKTKTLRSLLLWLAQDPSVRFHMADLKPAGDLAMFTGLADELHQVPGEEGVEAATLMLEAGVREMETRQRLITSMGLAGVTAEMAKKDPRFCPRFYVVDEAQLAFMSPAKGEDGRPYGGTKANSRFFLACRRLLDQGRAFHLLLVLGTQNPTNQNLPVMVREGFHTRVALKLNTASQAAMALGDTPAAEGAAPHRLRQDDKGVVVVAGDAVDLPKGQSSVVIRTHFIDNEPAAALAAQAIRRRRGAVETRTAIEAAPVRDLLVDVLEAIGDRQDRVLVSELARLLHNLAPEHPAYQGLTGKQLAELLDDANVRIYTTGRRPQIEPDEVRTAATRRDEPEPDEE